VIPEWFMVQSTQDNEEALLISGQQGFFLDSIQ